jgi:predicted DNA-binding protein (UPF0251 family)
MGDKINKKRKSSPTVIVDEAMLKSMEIFAGKGLNIEQIAALLGHSRATLYRLKKNSKKIETAIKKGRETAIGLVVGKLFDKAMQGDNVAMIFFLKNKDPEHWKDKHEHDVSSGGKALLPPTMVVEYVHAPPSEESATLPGIEKR